MTRLSSSTPKNWGTIGPVSPANAVGIAVGQYGTPDALLRDADLALYAAKAAGKDRYALFDASMSTIAEGRLELEGELGAALRERQLFLQR